MKNFAIHTVLVFLCISGCTDLGEPYIPPRIQPGIGIDGVEIGQSRERAWEVLGPPDGGGFYDGIFGGGTFEMWDSGSHAGLSLYYYEYFDNNQPQVGPINVVRVRQPFSGTTANGIGIGSRVERVLQAFREPIYQTVDSTGYGIVVCCFSGRYLILTFTDSLMTSLETGYYAPPKRGLLPFFCP